jgi:hypothetical protein
MELEAGLLDANDHQPLVRHRVHKVLPVHLDRVYRISNADERREQQRDCAQNLCLGQNSEFQICGNAIGTHG